MPAVGDCFPLLVIAQWTEQQPDKLWAAGSNPAFQTATDIR